MQADLRIYYSHYHVKQFNLNILLNVMLVHINIQESKLNLHIFVILMIIIIILFFLFLSININENSREKTFSLQIVFDAFLDWCDQYLDELQHWSACASRE